jgi:hypothetical protein
MRPGLFDNTSDLLRRYPRTQEILSCSRPQRRRALRVLCWVPQIFGEGDGDSKAAETCVVANESRSSSRIIFLTDGGSLIAVPDAEPSARQRSNMGLHNM